MRITINLASRPYVELRPIFKQLRIAIAVLLVVAVGLTAWLMMLRRKAHDEQAKMDAVNARTNALRSERSRNEARMKQPINAAELQRSQFLNSVFARKSFSWTAVLMDLEQVLPAGVQVSSIEPVVLANGDVTIRLRVIGPRENAIELVRNLEHSKRFLVPRLSGESSQTPTQTQNGFAQPQPQQNAILGGVEFEILAAYNPLQPRLHEKPAKAEEAKQ